MDGVEGEEIGSRERIEIERRDIKAIASDVLIRSEVVDVTKVANN